MSSRVYAQIEIPKLDYWGDKTFRAGLFAGGNFSQVDGDTDAGVHKVGLNAGAGVYLNFMKHFGASTEILFSQKGSRLAREEISVAGPYYIVYAMKLNYLDVPLLLQGYISDRIHLGAGAVYSRLISSEETYRGLYNSIVFEPDIYVFEKNTWSYVISGSVRLSSNWLLDARFQLSITPIRMATFVPEGFTMYRDQMDRTVSLRVGYFFQCAIVQTLIFAALC